MRLTQLATDERASGARAGSRGEALRRESAVSARLVAHGDRIRWQRGSARLGRSRRDGAHRRVAPRRPPRGAPRRGVRAHVPSADAGLARCRRRRAPADPATLARLGEFFEEEPDGYLRFRRSLLRDTAYEGLPYKLRRRLHGVVAARFEKEIDLPGGCRRHPVAALLRSRRVSPGVAIRHGGGRARAGCLRVCRGRRTCTRAHWRPGAGWTTSAITSSPLRIDALGDSWYQATEFDKASEALHAAARALVAGDLLMDAGLLLKISRVEEKLGESAQALRWAAQARAILQGLEGSRPPRAESRARARGTRRAAAGRQDRRSARAGRSRRWPRPKRRRRGGARGCVFRAGMGVRRTWSRGRNAADAAIAGNLPAVGQSRGSGAVC